MARAKPLKIISWNVNGIRAAQKKGFGDFVAEESPDIICLQEVKARAEQVELDLKGYEAYWNSAEKPGYSGTLILTKKKPLKVHLGLGKKQHDTEGRMVTLEFSGCFITTVYTPNSKRELTRLDYRTNEWDKEFLKFVRAKAKIKPIIFCGDLNVAHKEIDLANPKTNKKNAGFTPEERHSFDLICKAGFLDTFREFESGPGHYTWWSYRAGARARNIGWRLDYFLTSPELKESLKSSDILAHVEGSDHCPIRLTLDPKVLG